MFITKRHQQGDTIVEVLIAIAIVSLTLTGAYTSVNQSTNAVRTAQERGEALKWAETQVEQIKAGAQTGASFCYLPNLQYSPTTPCATTDPVPYKATITESTTTPGSFKVLVQWDALNSGVGTNNVELDYLK